MLKSIAKQAGKYLVLNLVVGFILGCGFYLNTEMAPDIQQSESSATECFNSSTGQIFTLAPGEKCSKF